MKVAAPKSLVLHYLPVRAKAGASQQQRWAVRRCLTPLPEPLRMMLRHGGIAYESHVFTWPEWAAAKKGACGRQRALAWRADNTAALLPSRSAHVSV